MKYQHHSYFHTIFQMQYLTTIQRFCQGPIIRFQSGPNTMQIQHLKTYNKTSQVANHVLCILHSLHTCGIYTLQDLCKRKQVDILEFFEMIRTDNRVLMENIFLLTQFHFGELCWIQEGHYKQPERKVFPSN